MAAGNTSMSDLWDNPPISSRGTLHGFQDQEDIGFSAVPVTLTVHEWRAAILSARPTTGQNGGEPELATMYLPVSHLRARHPDTSLVIGAHGMGKSFRTAVPVSDTRRVLLENTLFDPAGIVVRFPGWNTLVMPQMLKLTWMTSGFLSDFFVGLECSIAHVPVIVNPAPGTAFRKALHFI